MDESLEVSIREEFGKNLNGGIRRVKTIIGVLEKCWKVIFDPKIRF